MQAEQLYGDPGFPLFTAHTFSISTGFRLSQAALPSGWGGICNPLSQSALLSADVSHYDLAHVGNPRIPLVN